MIVVFIFFSIFAFFSNSCVFPPSSFLKLFLSSEVLSARRRVGWGARRPTRRAAGRRRRRRRGADARDAVVGDAADAGGQPDDARMRRGDREQRRAAA